MRAVTIPGVGGSDEHHWQSYWDKGDDWTRFTPTSWDEPDVDEWIAALDASVGDTQPILVAHSLGCLTAVRWSYSNPDRVAGLFLVAPPDPKGHHFPSIAAGFGDGLVDPIAVPTLIVSSSDDPYCATDRAEHFAAQWRAPRVEVGARGHLNSMSKLGHWHEGRNLLTAFMAGLLPHQSAAEK